MEVKKGLLAMFGLDPLFEDIVAAALSGRGWHVLDLRRERLHTNERVGVVLACSAGDLGATITTVREARSEFPSAKVVLLGIEATDTEIVRLIEEGVTAFVASDQSLTQLTDILEMVRMNRTTCSGRIARLVVEDILRLTRQYNASAQFQLTLREKEILRLIREGLSNKEIGSYLSIAHNTVKNHVHHLLEKLKVSSRHEAAYKQTHLLRSFPVSRATRKDTRPIEVTSIASGAEPRP